MRITLDDCMEDVERLAQDPVERRDRAA